MFVGSTGLALALGAMQAHALEVDPRIQQIMSSPAALEKAQNDGKKSTYFCANCHGEKGNSAYDYIPNLAGQNASYLLNQIRKFADGRRQDDFMTGLIKVMKDEDRFNVAIFYSTQMVNTPAVKDTALTARGKEVFSSICSSCHGAKGYGSQSFARLAGQQAVYITQSLGKYRKGAKERSDPVMGSVARRLSENDITAVAAYIQGMK